MANLCREAALGPIRSIADIQCIDADQVRMFIADSVSDLFNDIRARTEVMRARDRETRRGQEEKKTTESEKSPWECREQLEKTPT